MTNKCWVVKMTRRGRERVKRFYIPEDPGGRETARRNALAWADMERSQEYWELVTVELEERRTQ